MAQGALTTLLEKERPGQFQIVSSGTSAATGYPATMYAIEAAKIWECDISSHRSQPLTAGLIDNSDLILTMSPSHYREVVRIRAEAEGKTFLLKRFPTTGGQGEQVEDPIGQTLDKYNETFLEIGEYLGKHLEEITRRIDGDKSAK